MEALPNRIIRTILFVYIYFFYQNRFSSNFNLPQKGACKDSEPSPNRVYSGVAGVPSVTLDKPRVMVPVGTSSSGALCICNPHSGTLWIVSNAQCTLLLSPVQHFKILRTVWSSYILKLCVESETMGFILFFYVIS